MTPSEAQIWDALGRALPDEEDQVAFSLALQAIEDELLARGAAQVDVERLVAAALDAAAAMNVSVSVEAARYVLEVSGTRVELGRSGADVARRRARRGGGGG